MMAVQEETNTTTPSCESNMVEQEGGNEIVSEREEEKETGPRDDTPKSERNSERKSEDEEAGTFPSSVPPKDTAESKEETKTSSEEQTNTTTTTTPPTTTTTITTPKDPQPRHPQQSYVQYVPPYRAIVQGLTRETVGGHRKLPIDYSKINYRDFSKMSDPLPDGRNRGGVAEIFPVKLHRMLRQIEFEGKQDIVSFCSHGRAFLIHKPKRFESEIMTRFFRQTRVQSFQRQLNLYGFKRITRGPDTGGYFHELFLRGRSGLVVNMHRTRIKGAPKKPDDPDSEPDLYSMPILPVVGNTVPQQIPMGNMAAPAPMFPSYMYPTPGGVAGPYTVAQTPPLPYAYAASQFGNNGAPMYPPTYPNSPYPYPYPAYPPPLGQEQEQTRQGGEIKPQETSAEGVDAIASV